VWPIHSIEFPDARAWIFGYSRVIHLTDEDREEARAEAQLIREEGQRSLDLRAEPVCDHDPYGTLRPTGVRMIRKDGTQAPIYQCSVCKAEFRREFVRLEDK